MALTKIRLSNLTQPLDQDLSVPSLSASASITSPYFDATTIATGYQLNGTTVLNYSGGNVVLGDLGAGVRLDYAGSNKLITSNTGISVTGDITTSGILDVNGTEILVGTNNSRFAENNLRFLSAGTAYIDHSTVGQEIRFRVSNSSALDTAALIITSAGDATISGDLTVSGDFLVSGNTSTINADNLLIEDLNITLANGAANSAVADGAGITIDGANATLTYTSSGDRFSFNKNIITTVPGNNEFVLESTSGTSSIQFNTGSGTLTSFIRGGTGGTANLKFQTAGNNDRLAILANGDIDFYENNGGTPQIGMHWDYADGRLGINGITTPNQTLAVGVATNANPPGLGNSTGEFSILKTDGNSNGAYGLLSGLESSGDYWMQVQRVDGTATAYHLKLQPSGGKVGIGTTYDTPITSLDVKGNIALSNTGTGSRYVGFYSNVVSAANNALSAFIEKSGDNLTIYNDDPGVIQIGNNGATRLRVGSNGNVSIGSYSPYDLLWPDGSTGSLSLQANTILSAYNNAMYLSQNWYYNAGEKYLANGYASRYAQVDGKHIFSTVGNNTNGAGHQFASWTTPLTVDNSGYIGFGIGNPETKLHAFGNGYYQSALTLTRQDTSGYTGSVIFEKKKVDGGGNATPLVTGDRVMQIYSQGYSNTAGDIRYGPEIVADLTADAVSGQNFEADTKFLSDGNTNFTVHYDGDATLRGEYRTQAVRHDVPPSFRMDFANSKTVPADLVVRRGGQEHSAASYYDDKGVVRYAAPNTARITHDPLTGECKGLLLEKSMYNKIEESETFSYWGDATASLLIRQYNFAVAPDGSFNATRLVPGFGSKQRQAIYALAGIPLSARGTYSVYAKNDGCNRLQLSAIYGANSAGFSWGFTLNTDGTYSTSLMAENTFANSEAYAEYIGDGWFRCIVNFTNDSANSLNYFIIGVGGDTNITGYTQDPFWKTITSIGNGVDGMLVWGAQLEDSPHVSSYVPSRVGFTSRAGAKAYWDEENILQIAPANVEASGYNHRYQEQHFGINQAGTALTKYYEKPATNRQYPLTGWCPHREVTSTNLFPRSVGHHASNTGANITGSGSYTLTHEVTAPDGSVGTVSKFVFGGNSDRIDTNHGTAVNNSYYTLSFWIKGTAGEIVRTALLNSSGANIEPAFVLNGDWQKISVTRYYDSAVDPDTDIRTHVVIIRDAPGAYALATDGTVGVWATTVYIWGVQLENTQVPTGYIPTYGTSVTRSEDILDRTDGLRYEDQAIVYMKNNDDWFNIEEGTIFTEVEFQNASEDGALTTVYGLTDSEDQGIGNALVQFHTSSTAGRVWTRSGTSELSMDNQVGKRFKIAQSYDATTVTSTILSDNIDTGTLARSNAIIPKYILFNEEVANGYQQGFTMKHFTYYPKALTTLTNLVEE